MLAERHLLVVDAVVAEPGHRRGAAAQRPVADLVVARAPAVAGRERLREPRHLARDRRQPTVLAADRRQQVAGVGVRLKAAGVGGRVGGGAHRGVVDEGARDAVAAVPEPLPAGRIGGGSVDRIRGPRHQ